MAFWVEVRRHRIRSLKTAVMLSCWLALGMSLGVVGPTLLDLQELVQTDTGSIAFALTARSGGYALGSFLSRYSYSFFPLISDVLSIPTVGVIYERINFLAGTGVAYILAACLTLSFGFLRSLWSLLLAFTLNGACLGFVEAGSNVFILHLWGRETAPFMQSLHFMFGSGSLIAPLIAEPFLIVRNSTDAADVHGGGSDDSNRIFHPDEVRLYGPYSIIACLLLANAILILSVFKVYPVTEPHPTRVAAAPEAAPASAAQPETNGTRNGSLASEEDEGIGESTDSVKAAVPLPNESQTKDDGSRLVYDKHYAGYKILTIVLVLIFMHIYLGLEISFGSYLMTFAVNSDLKLSKATGAHLTTLFWSTFTLCRVVTILVVNKVGNGCVICVSLSVTLIATAILTPFGNSSEPLLWTGIALIGCGMSAVWACMFVFLEEYFPVTSVVGSLMIVSGVLGEFVFPVIISAFIKDYPQILLWTVLFCSVSISLLFAAISLILRSKLTPIRVGTDGRMTRASLSERKAANGSSASFSH